MNPAVLNKEVQKFLEENYDKELAGILLKGSPFPEVSTQELAVQLVGKKRAKKKLPTWFKNPSVIYPPGLNLEQTSSEKTAAYKSGLLEGRTLVDLTGGFGVDSYYFSQRFEKVVHCEIDPELSKIVDYNFQALEVDNIECFGEDGIEFLRTSTEEFDWIYIDPSRRNDIGGRVFRLSDCLPNVPEHIDLILSRSRNILIKTSPLLDLQAGILTLKNVHEIYVVAIDNEVKELLWIVRKNPSEEIIIKTKNFQKKGSQTYTNLFGKSYPENFSAPLTYLYEPNAAIMKSGLFSAIGHDFDLGKLHPNTHLYTSEKLLDFPGRRFEVLEVLSYQKKVLKAALDFEKAHVTTRNFPESVAQLRKKFKLKEGGNRYLFFTTTLKEEKLVLLCQKV